MKKVLSFFLALSMIISFACPASMAAGYLDMTGHSSEGAVNRALNAGIIHIGSGYFRPDAYITRAEAAEIVSTIAPPTGQSKRSYSDLTGNESYAQALISVCESGLLYLPSGGEISPNGLVSREEAAYLIYKLFQLPASGALPNTVDKDNIAYKDAVSTLYTAGYFPASMTAGSWFSPKTAITRAEFIEIICRVVSFFAGWERYSGDTVYGNIYAASDAFVPAGLAITGTVFVGSPGENLLSGRVYLTGYWTQSNAASAGYTNLLSQYTTYFIAGSSGRNTNVSLAASYIDGTILLPGEEFSYNKTVGVRSAERGFQYANIFVGNEKVPGLGGGVCQVSSTLFCAALYSALTITERTQHSMKVDYSYAGMDATVYYGYLDFRFRNDLDVPVKIVMDVDTGSGYITASLYAPEGYTKPEVTVNVTQSGGTYTTTRYVNGTRDYVTYSRY